MFAAETSKALTVWPLLYCKLRDKTSDVAGGADYGNVHGSVLLVIEYDLV